MRNKKELKQKLLNSNEARDQLKSIKIDKLRRNLRTSEKTSV